MTEGSTGGGGGCDGSGGPVAVEEEENGGGGDGPPPRIVASALDVTWEALCSPSCCWECHVFGLLSTPLARLEGVEVLLHTLLPKGSRLTAPTQEMVVKGPLLGRRPGLAVLLPEGPGPPRAGHPLPRGGLPGRGGPQSGPEQVLSLGAGLDSLYFCLKDRGLLGRATLFLEVDFPAVAAHKAALIAAREELAAMVGGRAREQESGAVHFAGEDYRLLGVDLAELPELEEALHCAGLDPQAPTLLLAEVALTYMEVERSDALIQWAARHFSQAWFVLYEQIHPGDPFGHVMQNHFRQCNAQLCSLAQYPDLKAQRMRFMQEGWAECHAMDMKEFYDRFVSEDERRRIQALEPFDEFEEWHLKCSHYFILVASKGEELCRAPAFPGVEEKAFSGFAGTVAASVCTTDAGVTGLRRYGHRSMHMAPDVILTTGGFGDHGGRHCRLTDLHALIKHGGKWTNGNVCLAKSGEAWDGRLFHTVTLLQAGWAVVVGGRLSPVSPALEMRRLRMLEADCSSAPPSCLAVELTRLPPVEDLALPRWRHTATEVVHRGERYLFIYGGCGPGQSVWADWLFLHVEELRCRQQQAALEWPLMLHNHSSVFMPDEEEVLLTGGGGNCFSFGSHLNRHPVHLALGDVLSGR
ncbi:PREDICTED: tRNA wybutosine-synthesizing protein 4 [Gekko japonicus]|uniref:tRNA wybutosine-synthesizing protein 4 n=1 Tax=Gekko japonicus TaxID=146911 RepID=A0ABM1KL76_GEKJA|nr:PREDICTED: tRNA wybutosine-synthesizing protein 4 [Gekko japonicus]